MAKKKDYGTTDRPEMERDEKQPVVDTGMPTDRFQGKVQTSVGRQNVTKASLDDNSAGDIVVKAAEEIRDKVKVRPSCDADVLNNKDVGGVSLDAPQSGLRNAAGAMSASVVEDQARISYSKGGYRPDGRFDRKISDNDFLINNEICEQIAPKFDGSKPLSESGDKKQGYFGRKQFTQARGKKNAGALPQSTLYDRSIDFVEIDATIHTTGQVLDNSFEYVAKAFDEGNVLKSQYPTVMAVPSGVADENGGYIDKTDPMLKSNYVLKTMKVTFNDNKLVSVRFNEDRVDAHATVCSSDQANLNWQIDRNNVANTTVKLQKELGRETTDKWSPLGYVNLQPYEYNVLVHDIEAMTGAVMGTAYRANTCALSYNFNNKLKKDGADATTPAVDMFLNGIYNTADSKVAADAIKTYGGFNRSIFNKQMYSKGSAAAIIAMFDTTGKYKTKAAFANYQKSLKFFVQQMDNNLNPLHCKEEFLHALDVAHLYSTQDGNYNPMLPIYATRKISLVNPMSLDYFSSQFDRDMVGYHPGYDEWGLQYRYAYRYDDLRNVYYTGIGHPLVGGIIRWILNHEGVWADTFGDGTVTMTCALDMMYPTLFGMILAAASQDILYARQVYFKDYLFAGDQMQYIYPDLKDLGTLNFKTSRNLTIGSYKDPLVLGKMCSASAIRTFWPETYSHLTTKNPLVGYKSGDISMPWFFSEQSVSTSYSERNGWLNPERSCVMSYPEVRHGVTHDYIDQIFSIDEEDLRLSLDRPVDLPIPVSSAGEQSYEGNIYAFYDGEKQARVSADDINAHLTIAALRYDRNSDGRIIMHTNRDDSGTNFYLSKASILCMPRELGFLYPSFRNSEVLYGIGAGSESGTVSFVTSGTYQLSAAIDGSMGYDLVAYSALGEGVDSSPVISRTAALIQKYVKCYADRARAIVDYVNGDFVEATSIVPAISGLFNLDGTLNENRTKIPTSVSMFIPNSATASPSVDTEALYTLSLYTWATLNRVFFPVNPFENCFISNESDINAGFAVDPVESCFKYGVAGFFGSDFTESVYDRSEKFIQLGQFYIEDDFLKSSLIMRV